MRLRRWIGAGIAAVVLAFPAGAGQVTVAVAANFLSTATLLADRFGEETGHRVALVHGSSGKLFAQIQAGAPYDVFLSADAERPARLVERGLAEPGITYALGRLALVQSGTGGDDWRAILNGPGRIAIADPDIAPYGMAAREVLIGLRGADWARDVVYGESVGQAFAFVATGNVDAALVGLAQANDFKGRLQAIVIPEKFHAEIRQDAVILTGATHRDAAAAFLTFLAGDGARALIRDAGYGIAE